MNTQKLNPSGYLINDNPMNQNPFFSFDSSDPDPTINDRLTNIENNLSALTARVEKNEIDILELKNEISGVLTVLEGI